MGDISSSRSLRSTSRATESKLSAQQLYNTVYREILNATGPTHLTYENVETQTGSLVFDSLEESSKIENIRPRLSYNSFTQILDVYVMPTFIHDCQTMWLIKEFHRMESSTFLTPAEYDQLTLSSGTTFRSFQAPYTSSLKQPDSFFQVQGQYLPTIVAESGWSETTAKLHRDMRLWLIGGANQVQLVLLPKWTKHANRRVSGVIQLWALNQMGNEALLQTAVIYPPSANQVIQITRKQLFGSLVHPGRNPNDVQVGTGLLQRTPNITDQQELAVQFLGFCKNFLDMFRLTNKKIYLSENLAYNAKRKLPPPRSSNGTCGVADAILEAIFLINPCFNVYQVAATCPVLRDLLGFSGSFDHVTDTVNIYFNRINVQMANVHQRTFRILVRMRR
ncbi:hypothetical protein AJ78_03276 [Emergomyces pasteurianus Ep9510]|uniref:Uncharacterized protein n=1 Tax=Emergomyces pasteurianus Ep9510 TaxID=1447872 RepID=A0A1J9PJF9_9EURO|nr:hypothetical protein AJ78_03276 [Emergomyces pasteurianus Ep9510]